MEAAITSEKSLNFYRTTRSNDPEASHLHTRCNKNLKSHRIILLVASNVMLTVTRHLVRLCSFSRGNVASTFSSLDTCCPYTHPPEHNVFSKRRIFRPPTITTRLHSSVLVPCGFQQKFSLAIQILFQDVSEQIYCPYESCAELLNFDCCIK